MGLTGVPVERREEGVVLPEWKASGRCSVHFSLDPVRLRNRPTCDRPSGKGGGRQVKWVSAWRQDGQGKWKGGHVGDMESIKNVIGYRLRRPSV